MNKGQLDLQKGINTGKVCPRCGSAILAFKQKGNLKVEPPPLKRFAF